MLKGSCLCGAVRYEITAPIRYASNCHCGQCRKTHGAAFASYGRVPIEHFRITAGAEAIGTFRSSSAGTRTFCSRCGSNLEWRGSSHPERISIALGTLDDDPGLRPSRHIFVASKAPWYEIADGLPQFAAHDTGGNG
jgi:hypothetical protein